MRSGNIMDRVWLVLSLAGLLLSGNWSVSQAQAVNLQLEPKSAQVDVGADFSITVTIKNVEDLGFFQFKVSFDPAVMQVKEVTLGDFLASTGRSATAVGPLIDNQTGSLTYGGFSLGAERGPEGDGVLAEVTFTGRAKGVSTVRLSNVMVRRTDNVGVPAVPVGEAVVTVGNPVPIQNTATPTPTAGTTPPAGSTATPTPSRSPTPPPTVTPGATATVLVTARPTLTVMPGTTPATDVAPTPTATSVREPTATIITTAEPSTGSTPSATPTLIASGEAIGASPTAMAGDALSATPAAGVVQTASATPGAAFSTASSPTSPTSLPSMAGTSEEDQPPDSQSQSPRWLLGVGAGALALAGLLAMVLVVYLAVQRRNT